MNAVNLAAGDVVVSGASNAHFELRRHLGAGAYGEVWLGRDRLSGEQRALKVVSDDNVAAINPEIEKTRRATLACGAYHVPQFYEASQSCLEDQQQQQTFLAIVMEFIDGPTLEHLVFGGLEARLAPPRAIRVVLRDMCLALSRLHRAQVIHGDIKGANILVARSGYCYLCDFGVSQFVEDFQPGEAMPMVGTPSYMAPEMLISGHDQDRICRYGVEADLWSLGVLAFELVYGKTPSAKHFEENNANFKNVDKDTIWQHTMRQQPVLQKNTERLRRDLLAFMEGTLVMIPESRSSADQILRGCFSDWSGEERRDLTSWVAESAH